MSNPDDDNDKAGATNDNDKVFPENSANDREVKEVDDEDDDDVDDDHDHVDNDGEDKEEDIVDLDRTPPRKKLKQHHRKQKYRSSWERNTELGAKVRAWLRPVKNNELKAYCNFCECEITADISRLKDHIKTAKHKSKENNVLTSNSILNYLPSTSNNEKPRLSKQITEAEVKISGLFAAHNLPFLLVDHLVPTLQSAFPDSQICKGITMKRLKCTRVVTNAIAPSSKEDLISKLKTVKFSILTDETTDTTAKSMCTVVRFYDCAKGCIVSRYII